MSLTKVTYSMISGAITNVLDFGADNTGATDSSAAIQAAMVSLGHGTLFFPAGTYKCNITVGQSITIVGAGRNQTFFTANNVALPIIHLNEISTTYYYYLGASDFSVIGPALSGIKIGMDASGGLGSATYMSLKRIDITSCTNNIDLKDTVGFEFDDVYCVSATNANLFCDTNYIATSGLITNCRFRLGKYGAYLRGGALIAFENSVFENNTDYGLLLIRDTDSGAKRTSFNSCWFEGNGTAHATVPTACSIYIDLLSTLVVTEYETSVVFSNCFVSSNASAYNVYLNRGSEILFDHCSFDAFTAAKLYYEPGTGYAFATLRQCGTQNFTPSPNLYVNMPALTSSNAAILQGFKYEYFYKGYPYSNNFSQSFSWQVAIGADIGNVTGNGATYTTAALGAASGNSFTFNRGGNSTNGTFTAPHAGNYQFNIQWPITNFTTAMTAASVSFIVTRVGSPTTYVAAYNKIVSYGSSDLQMFTASMLLDLQTSDTVVAAITITGGAGNTASLYRGASLFSFTGTVA